MNRKISLARLVLLTTTIVVASCKKKEEETPTPQSPQPVTPVRTVVWDKVHTMNTNGELCHYKMDNNTAWILQSTGTTAQLLSTSDGGKTWTQKDIGESTISAENVYFTSKTTGYIFLHQKGTYSTTDGGKTWKFLSKVGGGMHAKNNILSILVGGGSHGMKYQYNPQTDSTIRVSDSVGMNIIAFPRPMFQYGNKIVMTFQTGILRSDDGGSSWKAQETTLSGIGFLTMKNTNNWFVIPLAGDLYESTDDGKTWNQIHSDASGINDVSRSDNMDFHKDTLFTTISGETNWSLDGKTFTAMNEESRIGGHFFSIGDNLIRYNKEGIFLKKVVLK